MSPGALEGRVAVVTGGARGLGRAIARRFTAEGAAVAVWDRRATEPGTAALDDLVDVGDTAQVEAAVERVRRELGPVDILVNNAAVAWACPPWEVTDESWDAILGTKEQIAAFTADVPLRPAGRDGARGLPGDVAGAALYLAGRDSDYVTGAFLNVDGGARTG